MYYSESVYQLRKLEDETRREKWLEFRRGMRVIVGTLMMQLGMAVMCFAMFWEDFARAEFLRHLTKPLDFYVTTGTVLSFGITALLTGALGFYQGVAPEYRG